MIPSETQPWPGLFEVALAPTAYAALLYQLLGLPLGLAAFIWVVLGLSLSLGLALLGIGLLLGLGYLLACRGLAVAEARLAARLVGQAGPTAPPLPPGTGFWGRLGALLLDPASWGAQAFLLLRMPLGVAAFSALLTLLVLSTTALAMGLLPWQGLEVGPDGLAHLRASAGWHATFEPAPLDLPEAFLRHPGAARLTVAALGLLGFLGTLHLALALTRLEAWLGRLLLRGSRP